MASPSPSARAPRDRLSDLPDSLLGNILSYLPTKEAGCAAALSRRWRNMFCNVHAISFEERQGDRAHDWDTFYHQAQEMKSCSGEILNDVCSALLCRRRTAGTHVPLRSFRFAFDDCHAWNSVHVDQWLSYVLRTGRLHELHLDLGFWLGPVCRRRTHDYYYRQLGRRRRRQEVEKVVLPSTVQLPFLETLSITAPRRDGGRSVQRLISSCPRLVDLTLQSIGRLSTVSVLDKRLRRLAIRCCHNLRSVRVDASELSSLDYCGTAPAESLLSLHGSTGIPSCTVNFCQAPSSEEDHDRFKIFMEKISAAKHLHLHHQHVSYGCFEGLPSFSGLTRLALQGTLQSPDVMGRIMEQAPSLEILTLLMEFSAVPEGLTAPEESSFSVPCLRSRVKEINMVHYVGDALQSMMARLLFRDALVLERMCVVLVKGPFALQCGLKKEIEGWIVPSHVEKIFL
ncbi:Adenosylhomocysteinase [Hordeum vulgare]|nr:Adenosylhomocysteinase [Hordeum vulgare]